MVATAVAIVSVDAEPKKVNLDFLSHAILTITSLPTEKLFLGTLFDSTPGCHRCTQRFLFIVMF